ncbi:MAG: hypothetical protein WBM28_13735, partial [Burkholderiales bacterium]
MKHRYRALFEVAGVLLALSAWPAHAQAPAGSSKIALYQGADRQQRLIEGAKKERELTFYTS